jgi:polysaccharide biosynthesis/export protein
MVHFSAAGISSESCAPAAGLCGPGHNEERNMKRKACNGLKDGAGVSPWGLAVALAGLMSCTGAWAFQQMKSIDVAGQGVAGGQNSAGMAQARLQSARDGHYLLQKGDEIAIKVLDVPELNENLVIGPDGRISVFLLNEIEAAGMTVEELRQKLATRYAEYYREPKVNIVLRSFSSLKVLVGGEIERPGLIPLAGEVTALSAIFQAGGFRPTARKDSIIVIRNDGQDRPLAFKLNMNEVLEKGKPDIALKPFDVIYVPMSKIARVDQVIDQYVRKLIPMTLSGGFTYLWGSNATLIRFP